jgi:hypothetical protein
MADGTNLKMPPGFRVAESCSECSSREEDGCKRHSMGGIGGFVCDNFQRDPRPKMHEIEDLLKDLPF